MNTLLSQQGISLQALFAWQKQNAAMFQTQQQLALNLAAATPPELLPVLTEVVVPDGVSDETSNLLVTQADLANRFATIHNQLLQSGGTTGTDEMALFQQQNAAEISTQQQQAQIVAAQSAALALPLPPPLVIPAGSSPQMVAFLTLQDQLARGQIQVHNQYAGSAASVSDAAMQQWMQQNAANFQRLGQLAQNLSN